MLPSFSIPPSFEPGSGWYRRGDVLPGSAKHEEALALAAFRCVIFKMRNQQGKLPVAEVRAHAPVTAGIVCSDDYTQPRWHIQALALPDLGRQLLQMHDVRLVRMRGSFRQYQGTEYDERALQSWEQTWFCAPDAPAGLEVLEKMTTSA